jgi:hypothetical protein
MGDPFPLPFDPALAAQHAAERAQRNPEDVIEDWAMPPPLDRTGETPEVMRARLVYQTRKRGTLENDLLFSTFAVQELPNMSFEEMKVFDKVSGEEERWGPLVAGWCCLGGLGPLKGCFGLFCSSCSFSYSPLTPAAPRRARLGRLLLVHRQEACSSRVEGHGAARKAQEARQEREEGAPLHARHSQGSQGLDGCLRHL